MLWEALTRLESFEWRYKAEWGAMQSRKDGRDRSTEAWPVGTKQKNPG